MTAARKCEFCLSGTPRAPTMGDWVPFCERHWFALPTNFRMRLFETYRAAEPLSRLYVKTVRWCAMYLEALGAQQKEDRR